MTNEKKRINDSLFPDLTRVVPLLPQKEGTHTDDVAKSSASEKMMNKNEPNTCPDKLTNGPYKTRQKQTNNKNSRHVIPFSAPPQPNLNPPKSKAGDQFQPQIGASGRERPRIRDRRVVLPARERRGPRPRRPRGVALQEIQGEIASPRRALRLRNPVAPVPRRGRGRFRLGERWERRGPQSHLRELVAGAEGFWR